MRKETLEILRFDAVCCPDCGAGEDGRHDMSCLLGERQVAVLRTIWAESDYCPWKAGDIK